MALQAVHFLLSYQCTSECDHCFIWASPRAGGTMTLDTLVSTLDQAEQMGSVTEIYFEGGEPFLFYPILIKGLEEARRRGFSTGVVTNCYWATSEADARVWLEPLKELAVANLSLSSDSFHSGPEPDPRPGHARRAANALGVNDCLITIDPPAPGASTDDKGDPVVGGSVKLRGRAAARLTADLPCRPWTELDECPHERFLDPGRVHVDGHGHVHLCQGVLLGNLNQSGLHQLVEAYEPQTHPIIGPLIAGGPAELTRCHGLAHRDAYVDACHLCYETRAALRERFPEALGPALVYGIEGRTAT